MAELNGLRIALDPTTGGITGLWHAATDRMLAASHPKASVFDLAYPMPAFEPLRMGPRHSTQVEIKTGTDGVTLSWQALGVSRPMAVKGAVSAMARLSAAPDGQSVIMSCEITNHSENSIRQILFPDLDGLLPFAGESGTEFRTAGFVDQPFERLKSGGENAGFYGTAGNWAQYCSGAYFTTTPMFARWMDLGSLKGGLSLFPRLWSWGPVSEELQPESNTVYLNLSRADGTLQLMCEHRTPVKPGETWRSPDYVLTPHSHGWAQGIQPFRAWVRENVKREYSLPRHICESLGFRTVWMTDQYLDEPSEKGVVWRIEDLPRLAREAKEHGLNEMVCWTLVPMFQLPYTGPQPRLGSEADLQNAVKECRAIGVNLSVFVSYMSLSEPTASRYGWVPTKELANTFHCELIPRFNAYYAKGDWNAFADPVHPEWRSDVLASLKTMIDKGMTSITWDQVMSTPVEPNVYSVIAETRALAKTKDPESTFAGESCTNLDLDAKHLDYTWNWRGFSESGDYRALINAYPTPRPNVCVDASPKAVKYFFMDNMFLNVQPVNGDGINGSAWIGDCPELSATLKQCAGLRRQFLPYFTHGELIGDCILVEPCPTARVNAYVLADRMLIIVMNIGAAKQMVHVHCNIAPWLASASGDYVVAAYDDTGKPVDGPRVIPGAWQECVELNNTLEFAFYEVTPDKG